LLNKDSSELASGDISLFGIEITLFDATDAYGDGCYTYGDADPQTCTYDCGIFFTCTGSEINCNEGGCICYIQPFCD